MADPKKAAAMGVKVPNATAGEFVILRNLTRGGKLTQVLSGASNPNTVFNAAPAIEWKEGDVIRNLTRGGKLTGKIQGSDLSIVFNKAPADEWQNGDLIQGEMRGRVKGVTQKTIRSGGTTIQINASTDTSTDGVLL